MQKITNLSLYIVFALFTSFLLFEGLLGQDHLGVYEAIKLYQREETNLISYILNDDYLYNHRLIWFLHDLLILETLNFIGLHSIPNILQQYLLGVVLSFYMFISLLIVYLFFKENFNNSTLSLLTTIILFFSTFLISFFNGFQLECLIILFFALRIKFSNNLKIIFFIDILILLIKPFYVFVILALIMCQINDNKKIKKYLIYIFCILFILLIKHLIPQLFLTNLSNTNITEYFPWDLNLFFILRNFFFIFFSASFGIFFTTSIFGILIYFGYQKKNTSLKIISILATSLFLAILPFWHGQSPGGRYLAPLLIIFIPEIAAGINYLNLNKSNILKLILTIGTILTIFNLPSFEYRNTSIYEYANNTIEKKIAYGISERDQYQFPYNNIKFHPTIFGVISTKTIYSQNNFMINEFLINYQSIYPSSGIARLLYIIAYDNSYLEKYDLKKYIIDEHQKNIFYLLLILYIMLVLTIFTLTIHSLYKIFVIKNVDFK